MSSNKARLVKGMADFLPNQFSTQCYQKIVRVGEKVAKSFDYAFMQTPIVEERKLFERSLGSDTDIISKEMFVLASRDPLESNKLCLRPENTASVMRSILENSLSTKQRIYYHGPMFRYENPQKGRQRQFHQFGVEFMGSDHYQCDVESIEMAYQFLSGVLDGQTNLFSLEINSIGTLSEREAYQEELLNFITKHKDFFFMTKPGTEIDPQHPEQTKYEFSKDSRDRIEKAILEKNPRRIWRILDSKRDEHLISHAIKHLGMPQLEQFQSEDNRKRFENVLKCLKWLNIPYEINPSLIRGLDYYTHTTFEFKSLVIGAKSTVLAGGRYDTLSKQLGGNEAIPAVGWASGLERLTLLLEDLESKKPKNDKTTYIPKVFIAVARTLSNSKMTEDDLLQHSLKLATLLRSKGFTVNYQEKGNLSKQLRQAQSSNSLLCCVIGEEEFEKGQVVLRNMQLGTQESIPVNMLSSAIEKHFSEYEKTLSS